MASVIQIRACDRIRRLLLAGVLLAAGAGMPLAGWAQAQQNTAPSKQDIEAAYLFKFGDYVTWPDQVFAKPDSPIVIGVAGADEIANTLASLSAGRTIGHRPVMVRHISAGNSLTGVHILFIGDPESRSARKLFAAARGLPILVVTDGEQGIETGSAISFVVIADRVRFDVALNVVRSSDLKLSALLLSVAHSVSGATQ
jgi:hypothetical protein